MNSKTLYGNINPYIVRHMPKQCMFLMNYKAPPGGAYAQKCCKG